jgi:antitoxin ParD1/3/4
METTMTVSLPEPMKEWVEAQIRSGDYASASDYVRDLLRRDRARKGGKLTLAELRGVVADSKASGIGGRSLDALFAEAERVARGRS